MRGTIGGKPGSSLSPLDIVKLGTAYGTFIKSKGDKRTILIGRDARLSGDMVSSLIGSTLISLGLDVVDLGLTTTPTVEMAVPKENAAGGIIITASHNPGNWNALKFLNEKGEFISKEDGQGILEMAEKEDFTYEEVQNLGSFEFKDGFLDYHIEAIKALPMVDPEAIKTREFKVAVDGINSSGGIAIPKLLMELGVTVIHQVHCDPTGHFAHNPEPLTQNLKDLSNAVTENSCDLGISVDPDVDRLALMDEKGEAFGEEYTLVLAADHMLQNKKGAVVSNLSSSRALRDLAEKHGVDYGASAVGEVHVVKKMKDMGAVIGGEGNGGVILPELHYGRDALVGVALILSYLANTGKTLSEAKLEYSAYEMVKDRVELGENTDVESLLDKVKVAFPSAQIDETDGIKFDFEDSWVHLRRSNTEPIVRIYAEAGDENKAKELASKFKSAFEN